jgi:uncharacterized metal-binding protein YceD (DUF177 family)
MKELRKYDIAFSGLELGKHFFEFEINKEFFQLFDYSEISNGDIQLKVELDKEERLMVLLFDFSGHLELMCDRCGDLYQQEIQGSKQIILSNSSEEDEGLDDIVFLTEDESKYNIAHLIYEEIILSLPMRKVHANEKDCNQDAIKILKEKEQSTIDPRWEALKKLKE